MGIWKTPMALNGNSPRELDLVAKYSTTEIRAKYNPSFPQLTGNPAQRYGGIAVWLI
jgi:hypothetical protein